MENEKIEVDLGFATLVTEDENKESWTSSKEIKIFNCHERTIEIDEDEEKLVKDILSSNLGQLYQKYGFKRKEIIISHNVEFDDGYKAEFCVSMPLEDDDTPNIIGRLINNQNQIVVEYINDCNTDYFGDWKFPYLGHSYNVKIIKKG